MLQVLQHQKTGEILIENLPTPQLRDGFVLVQVKASLISAGTERSSVSKAQSSLLQRALQQPREVQKVWESVKKDGFMTTVQKVKGVLESYKPLGYSAAGVVVESGCPNFTPGDRVACAGNLYAYHAEIICVPKNLVVKIPSALSFEEAAYTTLGAIAMQGIRQAQPELASTVVVIGLGLLGILSVQLLKAAGVRVIGLDISEQHCRLAEQFGADLTLPSTGESLQAIQHFTRGYGADAVIITAATNSNEPLELALHCARKRANVVVVGAVAMDVPRSPFYEKELNLTIACSYGPGRYDPLYEEMGIDYPVGYIRWTENRNMEAFLDLLHAKKIQVHSITTHRFPIERAPEAYQLITGQTTEPYSGIILTYSENPTPFQVPTYSGKPIGTTSHQVALACIGAGAFAQTHLLPHFQNNGVRLYAVTTSNPVSAKSVGERFAFDVYSTNAAEMISLENINLVLCASRHDSHARYVVEALKAGKPIFVEKPLALNPEELAEIDKVQAEHSGHIMVGFNRRFSGIFQQLYALFERRSEPLSMIYRVNAGFLPPEHWTQHPAQGGRIIGEVCHFIDCFVYLTGAMPVSVYCEALSSTSKNSQNNDTISLQIRFSDGSLGTVHYFANGNAAVEKEYCEVYGEGITAKMINFTRLEIAKAQSIKTIKFSGKKGHAEEVAQAVQTLKQKGTFPIPYSQIRAVTQTTFAALESLRNGQKILLPA